MEVQRDITILIFESNYKEVVKINDLSIIRHKYPTQGSRRPEKSKLKCHCIFLLYSFCSEEDSLVKQVQSDDNKFQ